MTINDPKKYMAGVWDWAILDGCFGDTKIRPTDIDGFAERKGHFLFLETKSPGASIPLGQQITFESAAKQGHTVIVAWGEQNSPEQIMTMTRLGNKFHENTSLDEMRDFVSKWYRWADKDW